MTPSGGSDSRWLHERRDPWWRVVVELNGATVHYETYSGKGYKVLEDLVRHQIPTLLREADPQPRKLGIVIEETHRCR